MTHLVFIAMFLFGSIKGWLVVYFVRKYKEYTPKVLRDTALLFLGGVCLETCIVSSCRLRVVRTHFSSRFWP